MKTENKIYVAIGVLAALGGGLYATRQTKQKEISAHSATAATADFPSIAPSKEDVDRRPTFQPNSLVSAE